MKRALCLLMLVAACSGGGTPKDLGCLTDLGSVESTFNQAMQDVQSGTVTDADLAGSFKNVKDKLDDLAVVNPQPDIQAKAKDASVHAGRARVSLLSGTKFDPTDVSSLRVDIDALDKACVAAGK